MADRESPADRTGTGAEASERLRLLVAALVGLEALALLAGAVVLVIEGVGAERPMNDIGLAVVAAVIGLALAGCARAVRQGARWTRGPVLTWQLLQAGVGMPVSASSLWYVGIPILALAVVVGVLVAGRHVIVREDEGQAA